MPSRDDRRLTAALSLRFSFYYLLLHFPGFVGAVLRRRRACKRSRGSVIKTCNTQESRAHPFRSKTIRERKTCRSLSSAHQRLATVTRGSLPARHSRRPARHARHGSSNEHRDNTFDLFTWKKKEEGNLLPLHNPLLSLYSSHFLTNQGTALFCIGIEKNKHEKNN